MYDETVFQFTTSRRGRPVQTHLKGSLRILSIHDLTQRSTKGGIICHLKQILSIHDLTQRSTVCGGRGCGGNESFNSRPHAEVDPGAGADAACGVSFNSRPHAEVDQATGRCSVDGSLSIHDLTQRSTLIQFFVYALLDFQFTTSRRGRHVAVPGDAFDAIFQFTTSRRGRPFDHLPDHNNTCLSIHDLTQRSTAYPLPHPHPCGLSIHDLTQRSTNFCKLVHILYFLSIHDLTQRSTMWHRLVLQAYKAFNSRPHAEVDCKCDCGEIVSVTFNSRPHAEVDK